MKKVLCVELLRGCLERKAQSEGKADCTSRFQILGANKDQLSFWFVVVASVVFLCVCALPLCVCWELKEETGLRKKNVRFRADVNLLCASGCELWFKSKKDNKHTNQKKKSVKTGENSLEVFISWVGVRMALHRKKNETPFFFQL